MGAAQASALPTLTLALTRSSITVGGTLQSGAVNVVSTATGTKEAGALLFQLKPGVSPEELYAHTKGQDINSLSKYGSIVFDGEIASGKTTEAQTTLQPGQYVAALLEEHGKEVHTSFTVAAAASPASLPAPQATVRSIEFSFRGPSSLHDGELVRFENEGFLVHMDIAFRVKSKSVAKQVVKDLLAGKERQAEKLVAGAPVTFAGPLSHEAFQQETITAKPGWYVEACFMETQDGRDHTRLGMERIIKIVK
ncbi:MAG: hypothetical protein ABSG95_07570 [Solirubrobacteraceae bacterium]